MKTLVDRGVYQYDNLEEAVYDAQIAADDSKKAIYRHPEIMYVLQDTRDGSYYGPINDYRRQELVYNQMAIAHTAYPKAQ